MNLHPQRLQVLSSPTATVVDTFVIIAVTGKVVDKARPLPWEKVARAPSTCDPIFEDCVIPAGDRMLGKKGEGASP